MTTPDVTWRDELASWWARHGGLDGGIRLFGAVAVVMTIEALAGYFLWLGMTLHLHVPDQLGWTLQVGLAGGSAVGTRAFHRGEDGEWQFGLALSVTAVLFLLVDGAVAALLHYAVLTWNTGWLAVGVLVEVSIVGYLTVHTLMARTAEVQGSASKPELSAPGFKETGSGWGPPPPPEERPRPTVVRPVPTAKATPAPAARATAHTTPLVHADGWRESMTSVVRDRDAGGRQEPYRDWMRRRATACGLPQRAGRLDVERAEVARARGAERDPDDERERVPA